MSRYLEGVSVKSFGRGHLRLVAVVRRKLAITWRGAGGAAGVAFLFWPVVGKWMPTVLAAAVTAWLLTAVVVGAAGEPGPVAGVPAAASGGEDEVLQDAPADEVLYALIRHVAGLSDQGTAAHLQQLLEEGQKRGLLGGWDVAALKAHLAEELRLPVTELKQTFSRRQRVRLGVWLRDLPEAAPAAVPVVVRKVA